MVCPTCFCTTTEDVTDLTGDHAERWRRWDSCFDLDFSYLHGGSVRSSGQALGQHEAGTPGTSNHFATTVTDVVVTAPAQAHTTRSTGRAVCADTGWAGPNQRVGRRDTPTQVPTSSTAVVTARAVTCRPGRPRCFRGCHHRRIPSSPHR
jgi:hypothetical protein